MHADFIADRFNANYPHYKGEFARVITFKTEYAQSLIEAFSNKDESPHVALSVDMLDTGIDVAEVVNLVFFKLVRSKTKFWQMLGRGTRLCADLFGPGRHKDAFYLFDYCQNLEYFSQNPATTDGSLDASLGKRLFTTRLELIGELDKRQSRAGATAMAARVRDQDSTFGEPSTDADVRVDLGELLHREVAAMNLDNFVVRPKRRVVETYARAEAWTILQPEALTELANEVAGLPAELDPEGEEAKRFDLLILTLQLTRLRSEPGFERLRDQVKAIAGLLDDKAAIPMVRKQMALIEDLQTDEWWQDVTVPMLEVVRRRLRDLVRLIDRKQRKPIFTDFEDEMGVETGVALPGFDEGTDLANFRKKAQAYLRDHQNLLAIQKLRTNRPLTSEDLAELERVLVDSGVGAPGDIARAKSESRGLGIFVRSMVGMEREAAKAAFAGFLEGRALGANQIEFVNMVVNHLTEHGVMDAKRLYESPFTDVTPQGPDALFTPVQVETLLGIIDSIRSTALAA